MGVAAAAIAVAIALAGHLALRFGLRELYRPWLRWAYLAASAHLVAATLPLVFWGREARIHSPAWFKGLLAVPASGFFVSLLVLLALAPVWIPVARALRRLASRQAGAARSPAIDPVPAVPQLAAPSAERGGIVLARRDFLQAAALAPPAVLLSSGGIGAVMAKPGTPFVRRVELAFPGLPPGLDGTRLVQVSDPHVGYFVSAADLAEAMEVAQAQEPDLFLVTGDVIDDVRQLPATMEALGSVKARLGSFACLGNHEYYAGLRAIRRAFDASPIQLLVDEAVQLRAPGGTIELSAVNYPVGERGRRMTAPELFPELAERALVSKAPGGDFRLHLAHHPHAWDAARERGADLTLSGHTHGGQVGIGGRSPLQLVYRYIRGVYESGDRKLFVHSGLGHWLPVRIGCPAEIAVITLRRAV